MPTTSSSELGPIGTTKKSPSVTPKFWEPFAGSVIQRPSQLGLPQSSQMNDLTGSDSYFSQQFGDFGTGEHAYRGAQQNRSSLMDLQSSSQAFGGLNSHGLNAAPMADPMADLNQMVLEQRDWDANMFWQAMQKNEEQNQANLINWSSLWTSPPVFPHQQQQQQHHQQQPMNSRLTNNWLGGQRSNQMPLRAPPGFSPVKPNPPTNPQQMHPQMSAMQQPSQLAHLQSHQSLDPQQQQQDNGSGGPATYDPFRISIWTPAGSNDVWNEKK